MGSTRFDDGGYPRGYYQFQHLMVGKDSRGSVVVMRVVNSAIMVALVALISLLSLPAIRRNALVAALVAWVPMGVYFVSSINPTSWAVSGIFIYFFGAYSASRSQGRKRWALLSAAAVGAALSATSRGDSAFYILVVSVVLWVLIPMKKAKLPEFVVTAVASLAGLAAFLSTGQGGSMTSSGGWPTYPDWSYPRLFAANIFRVPEFFANFWGMTAGPGWMDVPLVGWTTVTMLVCVGGVLFVGAGSWDLRKSLAAVVSIVGLLGIPVVALSIRHVQPLGFYQSRYLLPLLAVALFVWLLRVDGSTYFHNGPRLWFVVALASAANFFALRQVIVRYAIGVPATGSSAELSFSNVEWWPWDLSPAVVLFGGSAALLFGLVAVFLAIPQGEPEAARALAR